MTEIARMRSDEAAGDTALADRYHLCFALGKALEDRGEYAESFAYYDRGNALKKAEIRYRPETDGAQHRPADAVCTREFFAARAGYGRCPDPDPIFVVGLPRSGSTSSNKFSPHTPRWRAPWSWRISRGWSWSFRDARKSTRLRAIRGSWPNSPRMSFTRLGEKYLTDTRVYRTGKPFFIDKMPNNFRHIGLIHLMLPNAKIIDARREPMACCFSNFKQLFASGQEFTYGIEDIARYYRMLCGAHGTLGRRFPEGFCASSTKTWSRTWSQRAPHPRILRSGLRTGLPRVSQDRAQRAHGEFRAGAPADLPRRRRTSGGTTSRGSARSRRR